MVSTVTVRSATPADAALLSPFAVRTFREAFAHVVPPDAMAQYLAESFAERQVAAELADTDTVFLLAVDAEGTFAGYAKVYFGAALPEVVGSNPVKLWRLYTAREYQGQGVGVLLLDQAVRRAQSRGGGTLWLTVNTENTKAIRFYERNGFVQTAYAAFNLGGEIQRDFVMERRL